MRDFASCFSEYATQVVSDASCSSYSNQSCISQNYAPSTQNATTCVYKISLSTQKQLLITATWTKKDLTQGLTIDFGENPLASFKLVTSSRLFRNKKKGFKIFEFENTKFEVFWDLSLARYGSSPEPIDGYYILFLVDSELSLVLGDLANDAISKRFKLGTKVAKSSQISRRENFSGNSVYATRAQFCDSGHKHDISIRCSGEEGLKCPVLTVCIDKKMVICVKRLQWNFRGNHSIFVDGLLIDLMWDVHDWFYSPGSGSAVFMFRTRTGIDNRLWLEEKFSQKEKEKVEFSLMIYACKTP